MTILNKNIFLLLFFLLVAGKVFSQDSTATAPQKMLIIKNDGTEYTGFILSDDGREILINTDQVGKLYLQKQMIKLIKPYDPNESTNDKTEVPAEEVVQPPVDEIGENEPPVNNEDEIVDQPAEDGLQNYHITTKNILSDNAMPIRKGEAFIKFTLAGVEAGIPLTKNWSLGGFTSFWGIPVGLKTKYCFNIAEKAWLSMDLAYGTMAFGSWAEFGLDDGGLVASTSLTLGERHRNFTVKAGYGFIHRSYEQWQWDDNLQNMMLIGKTTEHTHLFFANLGGMFRLSERSTFVFDAAAVYIDGFFNIGAGAAVRFGKNPRRQWQLGGSLAFVGDVIPVLLPHISYTFVFSERNTK